MLFDAHYHAFRVLDATLSGYEFGADRVKHRAKRREVVRGSDIETTP